MKEIWKPAKYICDNGVVYDYNGYYMVSNKMNVISLARVDTLNKHRKERKIKPLKGEYLMVRFYKNSQYKTLKLHRVIASTFPEICGEWFPQAQAHHIDEDKYNANAENIKWVSPSINCTEGSRLKRIKKQTTNGKCSKQIIQYDMNGTLLKEWSSMHQVSRELNISFCNISACCNGRKKSAGGYIWKYKKAV